MMDYKEKIRKLLALAESENENEAKAALLKARELMAEHKLSEMDCVDAAKQKVKVISSTWTATKRRDPWLITLAAVIGEHYCCQAIRTHMKGKQTQVIRFIGLEDDVDLCLEIFDYAVSCIQEKNKKIRRVLSPFCKSDYIKAQCDSYGYGFANGLLEAFILQQQTNEKDWGLVLAKPKEVTEATRNFGTKEFRSSAEDKLYESAYQDGKADGSKFNPGRVLKGQDDDRPLLAEA